MSNNNAASNVGKAVSRVAVVGSGVAGLAAAIRLRVRGDEVTVFETNSTPGGKLTEFYEGDYRFDAGPSLFTMPQFVDELFELAGKNPRDYFSYQRLDTVCRYFWEDGTRLSAFSDTERFAKEVEGQLGVTRHFLYKALEDSRVKYELTGKIFLFHSLHRLGTWFSMPVLKALLQIGRLHVFSTMNRVNERLAKHPKLVQLFNRYATYNGSNPYKAPGILTIIPHLEHHFGAWIPKGGMYDITEALYRLACDLGVEFRFNARVDEIHVVNSRATGVKSAGAGYPFDAVLSNMDVWHTFRKLLPHEKAPERALKQPRSSSALIFYWGVKGAFPELDLHNILFAENYREEFACIFDKKDIYRDPTVYINITSKYVPGDAPEGCENWFVMVNVPPNEGQDWDALIARARRHIQAKVSRMLGRDIAPLIACERVLDPRGIEANTSSYQGSLYGTSSNNRYAAFLRHANFSHRIKGLYFCGGSVHPGGGIPLCLLSGKIVSEMIP